MGASTKPKTIKHLQCFEDATVGSEQKVLQNLDVAELT
jgi:hypothetical protein